MVSLSSVPSTTSRLLPFLRGGSVDTRSIADDISYIIKMDQAVLMPGPRLVTSFFIQHFFRIFNTIIVIK